MSTNDIDQYLHDPLSMPDLDSFTTPEDGGDNSDGQGQAAKEGETQGAAPSAAGKTEEQLKPADQPQVGEQPNDDKSKDAAPESVEQVVKSKDGKHEIPYSVLAKEREDRIRAERVAQDLTEQIAALQHAKETGQSVKVQSIDEIIDKTALDELREELPSAADVIDKLVSTVKTLQDEASKTHEQRQRSEREDDIARKVTVEEAIAAIPKLTHVRTEDPEAFNSIAAFDQVLRGQPKWQGQPMQARFEAAVRMFEAANGVIELPGAKPEDKPATKQLPADPEKKVDEALARAKPAVPNTLSDIPGGALPTTTELESVEQMSAAALTEKLAGMTQEQQEEYLARLV